VFRQLSIGLVKWLPSSSTRDKPNVVNARKFHRLENLGFNVDEMACSANGELGPACEILRHLRPGM